MSAYFPPSVGGTSTVIRNLVSAFQPESVSIVAELFRNSNNTPKSSIPAGISVQRIGVPLCLEKIALKLRMSGRATRYAMIPFATRRIAELAKSTHAERIIAVYPSWMFLWAAQIAGTKLGIPVIPYYMDVSQAQGGWGLFDHFTSRKVEPELLRQAPVVLSLSEAVQRDLLDRLGVLSKVVPHSIDCSSYEKSGTDLPEKTEGPCIVVHTGVVDFLQREGLQRAASTIRSRPGLHATLVLSTPNAPSELSSYGLCGPHVEVKSLSDEGIKHLQSKATILLAVLPFGGDVTEHYKTSFPTKVLEYMCSGRPIMVHAPRDSFFAQHVLKHGYALLVDEPSESALEKAITRLMCDENLRKSLVRKASEFVRKNHDVREVARKFADACLINSSQLV